MARTLLGIDTGGTFTDFVLLREGRVTVFKTRSTPSDPALASVEGIRALQTPLDAEVVHGTTVATNALLQRRGARTAVVATAGFEDLLQIGRQARSDLYALEYEAPAPLAPAELRVGAAERVGADGEAALVLTEAEAERVAQEVRNLGAEAVAVSLLFSFLRPEHERMLGAALARQDGLFVSLSSDVLPEFREYERTSTVTVNAYVGPVMDGYLRRLEEGAERKVTIMQSSGGSAPVGLTRRQPVRTILSGPAGGVIGARMVAEAAGYREIMTLDMGGTSTDVSLCPGEAQVSTSHSVGGLPIGVPTIDIETVGAGGGSIARVDQGGALRVGPESAGADPGPACYGVGEEPTVTDANLVLGRMSPGDFLGGRAHLDVGRAQ
ncbi:MAG: hydantoinase/oxoprolinase family protein, partial [Chloroflexota bacterium]|nr:hydantoinase/oxoprolinase family protein [Chloroflexota bacterium]